MLIHRLQLQGCPDQPFSLPQVVNRVPYKLSSHVPQVYSRPFCREFRVYALTEGQALPTYFHVRLSRGVPCALDIAYGYVSRNEYDNQQYDDSIQPLLSIAADMLLHGSGATPVGPAFQVYAFDSFKGLRKWCEQGTARATGPCDEFGPTAWSGASVTASIPAVGKRPSFAHPSAESPRESPVSDQSVGDWAGDVRTNQ